MITVNDYQTCMQIHEQAKKSGFEFSLGYSIVPRTGLYGQCFILSPIHPTYIKDLHFKVFDDLSECSEFLDIWYLSRWHKAEEDRFDNRSVQND